jgi:quercetin dioxygenase-like cupin family protein
LQSRGGRFIRGPTALQLHRPAQTDQTLTGVKAPLARRGYLARMIEQPLIDVGAETVLSLADETRFAPNGIVSRTLFRTGQMRVVLFGFAERQELSEHTSTRNALIQILSGECEFVLAGRPRTLKAGDLLFMPANLPHAVRATRQFSMLLTLSKPD